MNKNQFKTERRSRIRRRIRSTIIGTSECPRLSIYKSNKNVYLQLIDDSAGVTLVASKGTSGTESAKTVGQNIAKLAQEKGISNVVFDRSGYKYHGIIKAVAEGARDGGLQF